MGLAHYKKEMLELHKEICLEVSREKIKGITSDIRKVNEDFLFYTPSEKEHTCIQEALNRGAKIILTTQECKEKHLTNEAKFFSHPRMQEIYPKVCSFMWKKQPSNICAVTGTHGKASIAYFFSQICSLSGKSATAPGNIYLNSKITPGTKRESEFATADAAEFYKTLNNLADNNIEYCCLEASAGEIESRKMDDVKLKAVAFSDLVYEDFLQTEEMEKHFQTKLRLFSEILPDDGIMILPSRNEHATKIKKHCPNKRVFTYGRTEDDIQLLSQLPSPNGQVLTIKVLGKEEVVLRTTILGKFQGNNLMIAIGLALSCGIEPFNIEYEKIRPPAGRMEFLENFQQEFKIMTDGAQTPGELQDLLLSLRWHFPYNDITLVLTCRENCAKKDRLTMSQIASKMANKIIVTDSTLQGNSAKQMRYELMSHCPKAIEIEGKQKAIEYAMNNCKPSEMIVILGEESKENVELMIGTTLNRVVTSS